MELYNAKDVLDEDIDEAIDEAMEIQRKMREFQFDENKDYRDYMSMQKKARSAQVSFVTTEEFRFSLRIIAAKNGKTISTFVNDFLMEHLCDEAANL